MISFEIPKEVEEINTSPRKTAEKANAVQPGEEKAPCRHNSSLSVSKGEL